MQWFRIQDGNNSGYAVHSTNSEQLLCRVGRSTRRVFKMKKEFGPRFLRNPSTEESVLDQGY
eukprot:scaffold167614_cov31-Attheya_sp.AAC.1